MQSRRNLQIVKFNTECFALTMSRVNPAVVFIQADSLGDGTDSIVDRDANAVINDAVFFIQWDGNNRRGHQLLHPESNLSHVAIRWRVNVPDIIGRCTALFFCLVIIRHRNAQPQILASDISVSQNCRLKAQFAGQCVVIFFPLDSHIDASTATSECRAVAWALKYRRL